jgi:hypothetical protein
MGDATFDGGSPSGVRAHRTQSEAASPSSKQTGQYLARIGNFMLVAPSSLEPQDVVAKLKKQLESDTRVTDLETPEINEHFSHYRQCYPSASGSIEESVVGTDAFSALQLSHPFIFHVHVPKKNQPNHQGKDDIPTEDYEVSWDGATVFVIWRHDGTEFPVAGGHVVTQILSEAAKASGFSMFVQACSPNCKNQFMHTAVSVIRDDDHEAKITSPRRMRVEIRTKYATSPHDLLHFLDATLDRSSSRFSWMKNREQRLLSLEMQARNEEAALLTQYYQSISAASLPFWKLLTRWRAVRTARACRNKIVQLWVLMATIESMHREWQEFRDNFKTAIEANGAGVLYEHELGADSHRVESLDLSRTERSLEQLATRIDNNSLIAATAVGAIAGGAAGLLAGVLGAGLN